MSRNKHVDREFTSLLMSYVEAGVFRDGGEEARIVSLVARCGLSVLDYEEANLWYERILPVLAKPLDEQTLVAAILRGGGRVPKRIEAGEVASREEAESVLGGPGPNLFPEVGPASGEEGRRLARALVRLQSLD